MKRKNKFNLYIIFIVVLIFIVSVGFATFNWKLKRDNDKVDVVYKKDIKITDFSVLDKSYNVTSMNGKYKKSKFMVDLVLPDKDSYATYNVSITNFQNTDMGIFDITGLDENLEYKISNYNLKDKICVDKKCNLGIKKNISITIKYKEGKFDPDNTNYKLKLNFDFREFYHIDYKNIDNYMLLPNDVIKGDEVTIKMECDNVKILSLDRELEKYIDYTCNEDKLVINEVNSNIIIKKVLND